MTTAKRLIPRPTPPPGPLRTLKTLIYEVYVAAGAPTLDEMARAVSEDDTMSGSPSRDTINRLIGEATVPPKQADVVALVTVLTRMSGGDGEQGGRDAAALWTRIQLTEHLGRPIKGLDAYDLEVHHAITVDGATGLPDYVERTHDVALRSLVAETAAGVSRLVMLVGTSSTGKTRACFEAVQHLPDDWRLWHPIDPERPQAALADLSRVGPKTVIWLNEAHHYLLHAQHGEPLAAGIRTLLSDVSRAPVLVLGTIWPGAGYYEDLRITPPPGSPDPHAQARVLLTGRVLHVPSAFAATEVARLRGAGDPRLAAAAASAEEGQITQYLAAGFELMGMYAAATPGPRALLDAGMDARRIGHPINLNLAFLASAAEAYLTDTEWDLLPDNWLELSLAQLTKPVKGARGPLHPQRRRRGASTSAATSGQTYRLADFLEAHGRASRRLDPVPGLFWQAALQHCEGDAAAALARAAENRSLMEMACRLWAKSGDFFQVGRVLEEALDRKEEARDWFDRAADAGDPQACVRRGNRFLANGRVEEAFVWYEQALQEEDPYLLMSVGHRLAQGGHLEVALEWLGRLAAAGHTGTFLIAANWLASAGRHEESLAWYQRAGASGDPFAAEMAEELVARGSRERLAARFASGSVPERIQVDELSAHSEGVSSEALLGQGSELVRTGRVEEALSFFECLTTAGDLNAPTEVGKLLADSGHVEESLIWFERAAQVGDQHALRAAGSYLAAADRLDDALVWFERAAACGDTRALRSAGESLATAGCLDDALLWYERAAAHGDALAPMMAADWLQAAGRTTEALTSLESSGAIRDKYAMRATAGQLADVGRINEALPWFDRAAALGDITALCTAARRLAGAGRLDEAVAWCERAADSGDHDALGELIELLLLDDRVEEAWSWADRAVAAGQARTLSEIADQLVSSGREEDALAWFKRAVAGGDTHGFRHTAERLSHYGRLDESLLWYERAAAHGDVEALSRAGLALDLAGRPDEALDWLRRAAVAGHDDRSTAVATLLRMGRSNEADQLRCFGRDFDGRVAAPWRLDVGSTPH